MFQSVGEGGSSSAAAQTFRIAVAVDSLTAPAWVARLLRSLNEASYTCLDGVVHCPRPASEKRRALSRRLYNSFDAPTLTQNAFAPVDLTSIMDEARVVKPPLRGDS